MGKRRPLFTHLSRRETQIMEVLYSRGEASVEEVRRAIDDLPPYDSIRVILGILETKGFATHRRQGRKYIYTARKSADRAKRTAVRQLLDTFFSGSTPTAVSALIDMEASRLSAKELDELAELIKLAKRKRLERRIER